jgi:hypothetical protein
LKIITTLLALKVILTTGAFVLHAKVDFNTQIRPILSDKCFKCHGPDAKNQKSDFRLDSFEEANKEHNGFVGLTPGSLEDSEIHWRIHTDDEIELMPPPESKHPLTDEEKKLLDQWIMEGGEYEKHWSFQNLPPTIEVPQSNHPKPVNSIDHFIAEGLKDCGLSPSPEVDQALWLRRATFDLTGLPPTLAELDSFLTDPAPDAYEKVVIRLLKSEEYAERMSAEWMDVARYSDTFGYQVDKGRQVWQWRDWVIRSFKRNMPYDQFVTEQIAGDLLPNATRDQILATCFNRLHSQKVEGGSVEEEFRIEYVSDRVHTFGTAFLGLTMECTKCHDHKYDPLTQKDYFSLSAFFNNIDEAGLHAFMGNPTPPPALELANLPSDQKIKDAEKKLQQYLKSNELRVSFNNWKKTTNNKRLGTYSYFSQSNDQNVTTYGMPIAYLSFNNRKGNQYPNPVNSKLSAHTNHHNKVCEGKIGQGIQFSGDDALNFPKELANFNRHQPFSVAFWIKPTMNHERAVVLRKSQAWTDAASRGFEILIEEGKLSAALIHFWPGDAIRIRSANQLALNEWTHVSLTYDGSSNAAGLKLSENGKLIEPEVVRDNLTRAITSPAPFGFAERMRDKGFKKGRLDEFYIYDRILTTAEIKILAEQSKVHQGIELDDQSLFSIYSQAVDPKALELQKNLYDQRLSFGKQRERIGQIMVMKEMPEPRKTYILDRGLYSEPSEEVFRETPTALPPLNENYPQDRLGLARWLTEKDHPLFARVTVNRYWQMIFGRGLVSTSEDFGSQGKPPSHPELLDWLARDFISSGWDLHHLLTQMVLSSTYRQISKITTDALEKDPQNILLARSSSYRWPAEMIRDSALAYGDLLHQKVGGPSVRPYDLQASFKPSRPDTPPNIHRRSLYTYWQRTAPSPVMMALDSSKKDICMVKRERTDSAAQSLVLLNGPQFVEAARATAEKLIQKHGVGNGEALSTDAFRMLTSRKPTVKEAGILNRLLNEQIEVYQDQNQSHAFLGVGQVKTQTKNPSYTAAVTSLVSTLMNFDESNSKR